MISTNLGGKKGGLFAMNGIGRKNFIDTISLAKVGSKRTTIPIEENWALHQLKFGKLPEIQ